ncbi:hypothetical protein KZ810_01375 [Sphingomonas sp. RHCKR47]|uniref:hypothetical protein n=1 Tax=Sphingomonas citricola TaxID=2862498 RepID=UPI001CA5B10C|nr:hypothetical protein [Sphingomonas citricola]MBW6522138.1 hypothetical protein [Sphingomonas citricola]
MMVLATVPLWWPTVPPLVDLPGHIGRYSVQIDNGAHPWLAQWYRFRWLLVGNLGVDLLVQALGPIVGLESAVKLIVMTIPALTVGAMLWIAREAHGEVPASALFALPLSYAYPFQFGFVNYALSVALALLACALWLRWDTPHRRIVRAIVFVPIGVLVWLAHVFGWGILGLVAFSFQFARRSDPADRGPGAAWYRAAAGAAVDCLPLAFPIILMIIWRRGQGEGGDTGDWFDLPAKIGWITMILRDRWQAWDIAGAIVLLLLPYAAMRRSWSGSSWALLAAAALLGAAFVLLPRILFGSAYADMRLAPIVVIFAILALKPRARGAGGVAAAALVFVVLRFAGNATSFWLYDQSHERELEALRHVPVGARLVSFVGAECRPSWDTGRIEHLPAMALVRRHAFSNDQWLLAGSQLLTVNYPAVMYRHDPSQIVTATRCSNEPDWRTIDDSLRDLPRRSFDYVWLIRPPRFDPARAAGLTPLWRAGDSVLYRIDRDSASAPLPLGRSPP